MPDQFDIPILFLTFNRPDTAKEVLAVIREVRPKKIFVAIDGAREHKQGEAEVVEEVKRLVEKMIDWPCEKKFLSRDKNLGCKMAVSSAITWFFENVEEGIILEDDCVPDISFFPYCRELLRYYRENKKVMMIGGANFQDGKIRGDGSYYLSRYTHIWGWATWRRAWKLYDLQMKTFPEFVNTGRIKEVFDDKEMQDHWLKNFQLAYDNKIDTWDFQWIYTIWSNNGLSIIPNVNMVSNIGFRGDATHTKTFHKKIENQSRQAMGALVHPSSLTVDKEADRYYYHNVYKRKFFRKVFDKLTFIYRNKF